MSDFSSQTTDTWDRWEDGSELFFQLSSDSVGSSLALTEKIFSELNSAANPNSRFEKSLLLDFQLPQIAVHLIFHSVHMLI